MTPSVDLTTPEAVFASTSPAQAAVPSDAIHCALARSKAVLYLLMAQLDAPDSRCSDEILSDALWGVIGNLDLVASMLNLPGDARAN